MLVPQAHQLPQRLVLVGTMTWRSLAERMVGALKLLGQPPQHTGLSQQQSQLQLRQILLLAAILVVG
jgi:hypothetical protein